jgi:hypothetical protein
MTKIKNQGRAAQSKPLMVQAHEGETEAATMARLMVDPFLRHGIVGSALSDKMVGKLPGEPRFDDFSTAIRAKTKGILESHKTFASELLTAQALSLDSLFTEFSRRAAMNMGEYLGATETYMRLALKAQSACRATIEALAKLHQPREQIVKHVHVNEGGQAVVADQFHQHTGGRKNGKTSEQPHATGATGGAGERAALPGPDPLGNGVPISGGEGKAPVPDARRSKSGRT